MYFVDSGTESLAKKLEIQARDQMGNGVGNYFRDLPTNFDHIRAGEQDSIPPASTFSSAARAHSRPSHRSASPKTDAFGIKGLRLHPARSKKIRFIVLLNKNCPPVRFGPSKGLNRTTSRRGRFGGIVGGERPSFLTAGWVFLFLGVAGKNWQRWRLSGAAPLTPASLRWPERGGRAGFGLPSGRCRRGRHSPLVALRIPGA